MGEDSAFPGYLRAIMGENGWTQADLSRATDLTETRVSRWLRGESGPSVENAQQLAAKTGRPVLEVFVAAGFLTSRQAGQRTDGPIDLTKLTDGQLLAEVQRRMEAAGPTGVPTESEDHSDQRVSVRGAKRRRGTGSSRS